MILPVFIAATVAMESAAIVFLIRGLRARTRAASARCAGHCFALAVGVVVAVLAGKAATLAASFGGVAGADPSIKATLLSQQIEAGMTLSSVGVPATALPVMFAVLLFVGSRRFPASVDVTPTVPTTPEPSDDPRRDTRTS